jgi:N-acetylmuramoyl-L-alanine amidase
MHSRREFLRLGVLAASALAWPAARARAASVKRPLAAADLGFLAAELELVRRQEWDATPPRTWLLREAGGFDRLTVHHAGALSHGESSRNAVGFALCGVLSEHEERNYGDIGYHFIVDGVGRVWEGRSLAYEGAHVSGQNEGNVGVMLLGNFEEQRPSARQLDTLGRLVNLLRGRFMIKRYRVYGHRDLGASACPGRYLYSHVVRMRV